MVCFHVSMVSSAGECDLEVCCIVWWLKSDAALTPPHQQVLNGAPAGRL